METSMNYYIERIDSDNYHKFEDMVYWRMNGIERLPVSGPISQEVKKELSNPNLYVYAACICG